METTTGTSLPMISIGRFSYAGSVHLRTHNAQIGYYTFGMTVPSSRACLEKERLMREFVKAVADYNRMQTAQVEAILRDEDVPFEDEIAEVAELRERAKHAVLIHRRQHGC
jgi:hypothetical protein